MTGADRADQLALVFPGDSEMAGRMRTHAWSRTPLGDPLTWPASLAVACRLCLTSSFPMVLWWGPQLCFLYNDAYRPFLGDKHPALGLPGSEVWGEVWQIIGGQLQSVLDTGTATYSENVLLPLNRRGYLEETCYSYSFSPLYDDSGVIRGAFTAVSDTTDAIIGARRLSPVQLPPGFAARYESAAPPLEIGGDWYDVVELPDGRIAIVVGDRVGHTVASATMGQLRSACRALLLVYSSAGHPPPIVVEPGGAVRLLEEGRSPALAVRPGTERHDARWSVRPRATLLAYTDSLVERRRVRLDAGIERAAEVLAAGRPEPVEDLAGRLMTQMAPPGGYDDDVAVLLYRYPGPLELSFPAGTDQLAPARAALREWLGRCDLTPRTAQDVLIAAGEAMANAYEHGSGGPSGQPIGLTAVANGTDLYLTVTDSGRWKNSAQVPGAFRGHGLPLMRALMTEVTVTTAADGTTVRMRLSIAP